MMKESMRFVTTLNFHQAARFATSSDLYVGSRSDIEKGPFSATFFECTGLAWSMELDSLTDGSGRRRNVEMSLSWGGFPLLLLGDCQRRGEDPRQIRFSTSR